MENSSEKSQSFIRKAPKGRNLKIKTSERLTRYDSIGAMEDLVQCGICLEKLKSPKMLPCQHTFCCSCLLSYFSTSRLSKPADVLNCPMCQLAVALDRGLDSINDLPKNLYIDSILKLVEGTISPVEPRGPSNCCSKCLTLLQEPQQKSCQHCMQIFCNICWNSHLSELESNVSILVTQVEESRVKLDHKLENFETRCAQLVDQIKDATLEKIELLKMDQEKILLDVAALLKDKTQSYEKICQRIKDLKSTLAATNFQNSSTKVFSFMNLHRETSVLLNAVGRYGDVHIFFDAENFRLGQDTEGIYYDAGEAETGDALSSSLERYEVLSQDYKTRVYTPKLVWNRCPRPANVAIPPWENRLLYIAATDTHSVLVWNRGSRKIEARLMCPDMLYPQGITFSRTFQEVYVSDKWQHCIHVFSQSGSFLRSMLSKGSGPGQLLKPDGLTMTLNEELVICDSGNNRILTINPVTGEHIATIGHIDNKVSLNYPTSVAVSGDRMIIVDSGNHRVKIFSLDGSLQQELGYLGREKGQFRSPQVVAVDAAGFILVGDAGNARIQIFKPNGSFVKVFGGGDRADGFGWVSGICVTSEMEIITTDFKNRCLRIF